MHEEIWSRLNMGRACDHLSYCWLYKNIQIDINRYIIVPAVLHGCET